ncbi:unnamed protein product, partial [marine sediment metagenome]
CGEYLGDYVNGVLFKFGKRVTEPHLCPGIEYHKEEPEDLPDILTYENTGIPRPE